MPMQSSRNADPPDDFRAAAGPVDGPSRLPLVAAVALAAGALLSIGPSGRLEAARRKPVLAPSLERAEPVVAPRPTKPAPYGFDRRVRWTTSRVVGSPEPAFPYVLKRAFPAIKFKEPVYMVPEPGTKRIFVLEHGKGRVLALPEDENAKEATEVFQVPVAKPLTAHAYSLIFHPNYAQNRQVIVFSNVLNPDGDAKTRNERNQIVRFRVSDKPPYAILPETRELIIEWATAGHAGGDMAFGADGFLYITSGDGTTGSDPDMTGQDITDLRGSILRIDIDHAEGGKPYRIPPDNPFLNVSKARPEIWAFGLRAPWRMSFDPPSGNLWVGEVGQDLWEMIHLIRRGGNYGWSVMEGSHPFYPERKVGPAPISPPIVEHHHSEARSITGGYVYHGKRIPELANHYLYCCYQTGTIWGFRYEQGRVVDHRVLGDSTYNCAAWGRDHAGELYLVALSGELFRLEPNPTAQAGASPFPRMLSETGLFASVPDQRPMPGVVEYEVNAPVWHDGASMKRFLAVPNADTINSATSRGWEFQDGAVLAQTLALEAEQGNPDSCRYVETRLLTRQGGEWFAYTYEWDDAQRDARLVAKEGKDRFFKIRDAAAPGGSRQRTWRYLNRSECMVCHSRAANFVLGMNNLQMNRVHRFPQAADNQLRTLSGLGYFAQPLSAHADSLQRLCDPYDRTADLETRVRSYLHANCSHCHVADGGGNARMELEFTTPRDKMNVIGVSPLQGKFDIAEGELIARGDPYRSVMFYRISALGGGRMPQVGSSMVDEEATRMLFDWARLLTPTDEGGPTAQRHAELTRNEQALLLSVIAPEGAALSGPSDAIERLLSTTTGALRLVRAIDEQRFAPTVQARIVQAASVQPNPAIRDLFERFIPEEGRVRRLGTSIDVAKLLKTPGDAARGRDLFVGTAAVLCQNCHPVNGRGRNVGPDLGQIGKKYNRAQLLESILEPSKTIEEKYVSYVVQCADGKAYTGLLVERSSAAVSIKDAQGIVTRLAMKDVDAIEPQKKSLMPEFLFRDLTAEQAADLLAYLESLK